jgi:hypothetical protein
MRSSNPSRSPQALLQNRDELREADEKRLAFALPAAGDRRASLLLSLATEKKEAQMERVSVFVSLALAGIAIAGCTAQRAVLVPDRDATATADPGSSVMTTMSEAGVYLTIRSNKWAGEPETLGSAATPLFVTIRNDSPDPVRIQYRDIEIVDQHGRSYAALPPAHLSASNVLRGAQVTAPEFKYERFEVAPYLVQAYPSLPVWAGKFDFDLQHYRQYARQWPFPLPTKDMIEKAIPEGVLLPGGVITGYVYVEPINPSDVERATVQLNVTLAEEGEQRASITIPMLVREDVG